MFHNSMPQGASADSWRLFAMRVGTVLLIVLMSCSNSSAYSVLTHEEIVDLVWTDEIRPLLLNRYPGLTEEQITEAHAYAYGGAVIQDLGYYPFGSTEFSDLVHYVRSGDFVRELLLESQDVNEYAFALGRTVALCLGYRRPPSGQPVCRHRISEAASEVWQVRPVCPGQDRALENGVRL